MAAPKTIVITLPKQLGGTPMVLPAPSANTTAIASKQLTHLLSGNFVQLIKEEVPDKMLLDDDSGKPPRKRQRLDHLTMEEKIMRRKLKNRVAAQTARDRKKMRMDQLEAQLVELTEHVTELTELTSILTEQNSELTENNQALQVMMSKCVCGVNSDQMEEDDGNYNSETQKTKVFEGVMIPVSTQIVGSAAGNQCAGSNKDHGSQCTLLPMGERNSYDPLDGGKQFISQQSLPQSVTEVVSEEAQLQQMVGTTATVVESSWDVVDHDYTKESQTHLNINLTQDEDDLITQLTNALGQDNSSSTEQLSTDDASVTAVHVLGQEEELATPDILKDFLDFENAAALRNTTNNNNVFAGNQNLCIDNQSTSTTVRAPSPISKAQILDFLQDKLIIPSPGSSGSSESGYDSAMSPKSVDSLENSGSLHYTDELIDSPLPPMAESAEVDEECGLSLDIDSFNELFPSLF